MKVLITPSGTETALEIYKSLSSSRDIKIFGLDTDTLNPLALILQNHQYIAQFNFSTPEFIIELNRICAREGIDLIFPTHDHLLPVLQNYSGVAISSPEAVAITQSKYKTAKQLEAFGIPIPRFTPSEFPAFFRPDDGRGSIGAHLVNNFDEFVLATIKYPNFVLTEYLPGKEYTIDCVNNLEGRLLGHCIRERINIKRGITHIGRTVANQKISDIAHKITQAIPGIKGGWFFQVKEDKDGEPRVLEVNLRISGTMCLTREAGLNIPLITAKLFAGEQIDTVETPQLNVVVSRHLTEEYQNHPLFGAALVIWDLDDTVLDNVLSYNTSDSVFPRPRMVDTIIGLHRQGTMQALCSQNVWLTKKDPVHIERTLQDHCVPARFFDTIRIDSQLKKSDMVLDICAALGIDYNHQKVVLIDDSFSVRQEVSEAFSNKIICIEPSVVSGR